MKNLKCWMALVGFFCTVAMAQNDVVRLGQIVPLSGPLANVGKEINAVTKAAIEQHNASGKPKIELLTEDDANNPDKSAAAVVTLQGKTSGLVSCFGTVGCMAQMKAAQASGFPLIGPIAGAASLRSKQMPHVFAIRASAKEELQRLLQFAQGTGLTQFAIAVQDDGFGQAYFADLKAIAADFGVQLTAISMLNPQTPNYAALVSELNQPKIQALLLLANASHSVGILKAWREKTTLPFVMNLAGQANGLFANGLKGYAGAAAFVTATPSPWEKKLALQRDYQAAMGEAKITNLSYLGFEAYINPRVAIEAIKRSKDRMPASIRLALERNQFALGGMDLGFGDRSSKRFTDMALLKADGTFKH